MSLVLTSERVRESRGQGPASCCPSDRLGWAVGAAQGLGQGELAALRKFPFPQFAGLNFDLGGKAWQVMG